MSHSVSFDRAVAAWPALRLVDVGAVAIRHHDEHADRPHVLVIANGSAAAADAAWRAEVIAQVWGVPVRRANTAAASPPREQARRLDRFRAEGGVLLVTHAAPGPRFGNWLFGTHVEQLVRSLCVPVLIVNKPARRQYRRVVVGVKLEAAARELIATASTIAPGARMDVVHVLDTWSESMLRRADVSDAVMRAYRARRYSDAARRLDDLVAAAKGPAPMALATRISAGDTPSRLLQANCAARGELIVIRREPRHWLADFLVGGSVGNRVLADSESDVLLVPPARPRPPGRALEPADQRGGAVGATSTQPSGQTVTYG